MDKTEVYHIGLHMCVTQICEKAHIGAVPTAYERTY